MTQPKRPDEIAFYQALRDRTRSGQSHTRTSMVKIYTELGMPEKRAFYLLMKWTGNNWWDYGMWAWGGWFTDQAPEALA